MDSTVTVQEVMDREFAGVSESDSVSDTAALMTDEDHESVVVLRGSQPVGLLSLRDALDAFVAGDEDAAVSEAMTTDVPTIRPDATIGEAAGEMASQGTQRLVVAAGDEVVGLLSEHDLVTASPFGPETDVTTAPEPGAEPAVVGQADDREAATADAGGFEDQSICEACGSFARDLARFNGQLLCGDCRDM